MTELLSECLADVANAGCGDIGATSSSWIAGDLDRGIWVSAYGYISKTDTYRDEPDGIPRNISIA